MLRSGLILMLRLKGLAGQSPYSIGKEFNISKNTARKSNTREDAAWIKRTEKNVQNLIRTSKTLTR
jgi:hypothetical protein